MTSNEGNPESLIITKSVILHRAHTIDPLQVILHPVQAILVGNITQEEKTGEIIEDPEINLERENTILERRRIDTTEKAAMSTATTMLIIIQKKIMKKIPKLLSTILLKLKIAGIKESTNPRIFLERFLKEMYPLQKKCSIIKITLQKIMILIKIKLTAKYLKTISRPNHILFQLIVATKKQL